MPPLDNPIPHPRRLGEVAVAILDALREEGIKDPQFFKRKHALVRFEIPGVPGTHTYHFPCTPRSPTHFARLNAQWLKRQIADARAAAK